MADEVDMANEENVRFQEAALALARSQQFVKGEPGVCSECGLPFARLVGGACGRCRDEYKLP